MIWIFWEVTSGCLRIQRRAWFDIGYMHCVSLRSLFKRLTYLLHEDRLGSPYSALRLVHLWIHARVCLLRLGIFTDFSVKVDSDPVVVDVPVSRLSSSTGAVCEDAVVGVLIWKGPVHRHRARVDPALRAGKGWRGRREHAPRRSATQLGASGGRIWTDTYVKHTVRTTTTTTQGPNRCCLSFVSPSRLSLHVDGLDG